MDHSNENSGDEMEQLSELAELLFDQRNNTQELNLALASFGPADVTQTG
jgi:hypothetical protein